MQAVPRKSVIQNAAGAINDVLSVISTSAEALNVGAESALDVMYVAKDNSSGWRSVSGDRVALKCMTARAALNAEMEELGISQEELAEFRSS